MWRLGVDGVTSCGDWKKINAEWRLERGGVTKFGDWMKFGSRGATTSYVGEVTRYGDQVEVRLLAT